MEQPSQLKFIKRSIKRGLQHIAARFGRHTFASSEPQLLVLMYHRILPPGDQRAQTEEPGMIVSPDTFRLHLEIIKEYFDPIALSDWLDAKLSGQLKNRKYCAITFDDGWADNYEFAFPLLKEFQVPATIFAVSEMIGTNESFWPERLAQSVVTIAQHHPEKWSDPSCSWIRSMQVSYPFGNTLPSREQLSEIIARAKYLSDQELQHRLDLLERSLTVPLTDQSPVLLDWEQINQMVASGYVEIGSHTCRHIRLNHKTPLNLVKYEISISKQQLEYRTGQSIMCFCFPNGDYTSEALEMVKTHYRGSVTTQSGWNSIKTDSYQLKRIAVHEDITQDRTAFMARLSGWI